MSPCAKLICEADYLCWILNDPDQAETWTGENQFFTISKAFDMASGVNRLLAECIVIAILKESAVVAEG